MDRTLNDRIRNFYDRSSDIWLDMWGEHMHHGYYGRDGKDKKDHFQAQIDMIKKVLDWADINKVIYFLDAGCGVGGSSRYLSVKYDATGIGVTLSPVQKEAGERLNADAGLTDKIQIIVRDMCSISTSEDRFDLIWSLESAEHIPDKQQLMNLFYKLLEADGQFIIVTWCRRNDNNELKTEEDALLKDLYRSYHLPPFVRLKDLEDAAVHAGFINIRSDNWSRSVIPFWKAVVRSAISWKGIIGLMKSGKETIRGAFAMRHMIKGLQNGLIEFVVLTGKKPN